VESFRAAVESGRFGEKFGGFTGIRSVALILSCRTVSEPIVRAVDDFFLVECFDGAAGFVAESGFATGAAAESVFGAPA
jgi:hypothetical protein